MASKKKILIVTERRADYSRFKEVLKEITKNKKLDYILVVTGIHLEKTFGQTINEIRKDGFKISHTFKIFDKEYLAKDDLGGMSRALSACFKNLTQVLEKEKPDFILSGFDIAANFALTVIGAHMNIPVGHIQGGEVSGNIDESLRHAMSKFAHFHFVSNFDAKKRLIKMGEKPETIFSVGCPSIDALKNIKEKDEEYIKFKFGLDIKKKFILVIQHPVTTEKRLINLHIKYLIDAIKKINLNTFIILPNNDYGAKTVIKEIEYSKIKYAKHLDLSEYKAILKNCSLILGNSSSGIHEAATFKKPAVNIGTRQQGRYKGQNIIDVDYKTSSILSGIKKALSNSFKKKIKNIKNPYGNGGSAKKIVRIVNNLKLHKVNLQKQNTY